MNQEMGQENSLSFTHHNICKYPCIWWKECTLHTIIITMLSGQVLLSLFHKGKVNWTEKVPFHKVTEQGNDGKEE